MTGTMKQSTLFSTLNVNCAGATTKVHSGQKNNVQKKNILQSSVAIDLNPNSKEIEPRVHSEKDENQSVMNDNVESKLSVSYEDFIFETISKKSQTPNQDMTLSEEMTSPNHHCTETSSVEPNTRTDSNSIYDKVHKTKVINESRKETVSVSYKEFLGMFKPAKNKADDEQISTGTPNGSDEDQDRMNDDGVEKTTLNKVSKIKSKSITSFFKASSRSKTVTESQNSEFSTLTVTAEVHNPPSLTPAMFQKCSDKKPKFVHEKDIIKSKPATDTGDEILLISSETCGTPAIDNDGSRKRKFAEAEEETKKDKSAASSSKKKKVSSLTLIKAKNKTLISPTSSQKSSGQSKLSFGAPGLKSMKSQDSNIPDKAMEDNAFEKDTTETNSLSVNVEAHPSAVKVDEEIVVVDRVPQQSGKNERSDSSVSTPCEEDTSSKASKISHYKKPKTSYETSVPETRKEGRLRLRNHKEDPGKNKTPPEDSCVPSKDQDKGTSTDEVATPVLRRSGRVRHTVLPEINDDVVIELDSNEDDSCHEVKTCRVRDSQKVSKIPKLTSDKEKESKDTKVTRKLAPIFCKVKPSQAEVEKPPAPTPEELKKQQARRDFLMSGIPEELKRVKDAMAVALQSLSDFPPFPRPSHTTQLGDSEQMDGGKSVVLLKPDSFCNEADLSDLNWRRLQWPKLMEEKAESQTLLFQDFSSHPKLDQSQLGALISQLDKDKTFPYKETVSLFLNAPEEIAQKDEHLKSDDVIVVVESPDKSKTQLVSSPAGILWTDLHPHSSKHIVGNGKVIKELKDWLEQWHLEMQKEAKKALREIKSKNTPKKKAQDWSDDSDFTDSSDDLDTGLCNTMLLTGPHGVGKTSSVYCLAREIGFKVVEVNPTSLRSGKQLLSQLEEATQSHRVVHSANSGSGTMVGTPPPGTPKNPGSVQETTKSKSKPANKALSSFFKKGTTGTPVNSQSKSKEAPVPKSNGKKKRGRKRKEDLCIEQEKTNSKTSDLSSPLSTTSSSIILFDEADVVLEDDKGFLSMVQHFMAYTKIPIIITSTNPSIHIQLSPRHEHVIFKPPPVRTISQFLYSMCLAKGIHASRQSLMHLASILKQDVRKCLLHTQYWCESGGGGDHVEADSVFSSSELKRISPPEHQVKSDGAGFEDNAPAPSSENSNDSDFLSLMPSRKRRKRINVVDDNSNSSNSSVNTGVDERLAETVMTKESSTIVLPTLRNLTLPRAHLGCDLSLMGGNVFCSSIESFLTNLIKMPMVLLEAVDQINQIQSFLSTNALVSQLAFHCCRLAKTKKLPVRLEIADSKNSTCDTKKRRRILLGDWLGSDSSDDENEKEEVVVDKTAVHVNQSNQDQSRVKSVNVHTEEIDNGKVHSPSLSSKLLQVFSSHLESVSCADYFHCKSGLSSGALKDPYIFPGTSDEEIMNADEDNVSKDIVSQLYGSVEILSARNLVRNVDATWLNSGVDDQAEDEHSLPIGDCIPDVWLYDKTASFDFKQDSSIKNVSSAVGPMAWVQGSGAQSVLHLDYLPCLREICRTERQRQEANTKRRFNHYLHHIGMNVKDSTIASLSSLFTVSKN